MKELEPGCTGAWVDAAEGPVLTHWMHTPCPVHDTRLVYCTVCCKTHAVKATEKPCAPGAWLSPEAVKF